MKMSALPQAAEALPLVDVDFSLAIHNRTGKYFIGRDLIEGVPERMGRIYYWLLPLDAPPRGLFGRVIGRLHYLARSWPHRGRRVRVASAA